MVTFNLKGNRFLGVVAGDFSSNRFWVLAWQTLDAIGCSKLVNLQPEQRRRRLHQHVEDLCDQKSAS